MRTPEEALRHLAEIPGMAVSANIPLSSYTRFGIGGPADVYAETGEVEPFLRALGVARASGLDYLVIGGGTNLIVSGAGYRGIVLRFVGQRIAALGNVVTVDAGAVLQDLVDFAIARGLEGLETLAGIPGSVGAAVYGNAGAYGHSISERVAAVRFFDGAAVRTFGREECRFEYRESVFKRRKDWVIFAADLELESGDAAELGRIAGDIVKVRNEKFPVSMKCAGSIFKNLLLRDLPAPVAAQVPESAVREGKIAAAWFLERVGAKGAACGGIHVAAYHANLIYNAGEGTAEQLCSLIADLKARVKERFGLELEAEVQFVGFDDELASRNPD